MGATTETGEAIHDFLSSILQQGAPGVGKIVLLCIAASGYMELLHSLFSVSSGDYDIHPPKTMCTQGRPTGRWYPQNSNPYPNVLCKKRILPRLLRSGL